MSALEQVGRDLGAYFTADQLVAAEFPDQRWAVDGLIAEGLTLLAGPPKIAKSWLALSVATAIACGGPALGKIPTDEGDVLYCALEDTPRRLQSRLCKLLDGPAPRRLSIVTVLPEMPRAVDLIAGWLDEHRDARMVVVDVLGKVRPAQGNTDRYDHDYKVIGALKRLADNYSVAVLVITHTRKMGADDPFDTVSGSTGLTGAADTTIVLRRPRGDTAGTLNVTGRDVEESEYALTFNPGSGAWTLDGQALAEAAARAVAARAASGLGDDSAAVVAYIADNPGGVSPGDVATYMGWPDRKAANYLSRLVDAGRIDRPHRGFYTPVGSVGSGGNRAMNPPLPPLPTPTMTEGRVCCTDR